jgi:ribonuclease inhibitor
MAAILDGARIKSHDDFHDEVFSVLKLPEYYGRNLDALWDCLTGWVEVPLTIVWKDFGSSQQALGDYADKAAELFREAAKEVEGLDFRTE